MQYIELKEKLKEFTIFSLNDIKKIEGNFYRRRLNEWQDKGYIVKVIKGWYIFSGFKLNENILFEIANNIYSPSYISFEMALSYYGLIPETIYAITSASSRRTYNFKTPIGGFIYKTIRPKLFFGYEIMPYNNKNFKIASCEKALLDYFYLNHALKDKDSFDSLRINKDNFYKVVNEERMLEYLEKFKQKSLTKRIKSFLGFMKNA
ncbi:MAG: hypothetical protein HY810_10270 [Candidatus Omnitrophica bacterium]|nr:hypothetical protein [Candidatus Omnitrophota bacterium]